MRWSYLSTVSTWFGQSCCFDTCCSLHPSTAPAKSWTSEPKWTCPSWTHLAYLIKIWPGHHAKQCHSAGSVWPRAWCLHAQAVPQHLPESSRAVFNFIPGIWSVLIPLIPFLVANIVLLYLYIYIHIQYIYIYTGSYRSIFGVYEDCLTSTREALIKPLLLLMAASSTSNGNCGHAAFQLSVVCECSKMVAEVAPSWKSRYLCPSADSVFGFSRPFNHFTTLQVCQTKACWVPGQFWHLHPLHLMQEAERCHWFEGSGYFTHIILNMDCISWNRKFASCLSTVSSMNSWLKSTTNSQASRFAKVPQFQNKSRYSSKMFEGKLAKSFHQVAGEHIAATCAKSI
jgi:hypothetical protein